jgi:sphinganine C4-monooxygenase
MNVTTGLFYNELHALPPLPSYKLQPAPGLIPAVSDKTTAVVAPVIAYWALSLLFHWIDANDYLPQYRLHTPAEVLKRNHVSRYEVVRDVIIQQIIQTLMGLFLNLIEPDDTVGKEMYDIIWYARAIRGAQRGIPAALKLVGVDGLLAAAQVRDKHPWAAGTLSGGLWSPMLGAAADASPGFFQWELLAARTLYWYIVPVLQFLSAIVLVDTWQYFLHRAMHMNRWLYSLFDPLHNLPNFVF